MKRAKREKIDSGGVIVGHMRAQGTSDEGLWLYALANARDCRLDGAILYLIETGIACPPELLRDYAHAFKRVGLYQRGKGRAHAHNRFEHFLVREHWQRFCAHWRQEHPNGKPPVNKWIEVFRSQIRDEAVRMGQHPPTDAELTQAAPESTLKRMLVDDLENPPRNS